MLGLLGNGVATVCVVLLAGVFFRLMFHWNKTFFNDKPATMEDYLFKIAGITGKSEYDIFVKSAEEWPITTGKIEEDFKAYLNHQTVPYYVRDFVRKNQEHIDEMHIPRF
jgi:hypothetical protein